MQPENNRRAEGSFCVVALILFLVTLLLALVLHWLSDDYRWYVLPTGAGLVLLASLVILAKAGSRTEYTEQEFRVIKEASAEQRRLIAYLKRATDSKDQHIAELEAKLGSQNGQKKFVTNLIADL